MEYFKICSNAMYYVFLPVLFYYSNTYDSCSMSTENNLLVFSSGLIFFSTVVGKTISLELRARPSSTPEKGPL